MVAVPHCGSASLTDTSNFTELVGWDGARSFTPFAQSEPPEQRFLRLGPFIVDDRWRAHWELNQSFACANPSLPSSTGRMIGPWFSGAGVCWCFGSRPGPRCAAPSRRAPPEVTETILPGSRPATGHSGAGYSHWFHLCRFAGTGLYIPADLGRFSETGGALFPVTRSHRRDTIVFQLSGGFAYRIIVTLQPRHLPSWPTLLLNFDPHRSTCRVPECWAGLPSTSPLGYTLGPSQPDPG